MNKDVRLISISNIRCTLQKMLKCIHIMLGGFSVLRLCLLSTFGKNEILDFLRKCQQYQMKIAKFNLFFDFQ